MGEITLIADDHLPSPFVVSSPVFGAVNIVIIPPGRCLPPPVHIVVQVVCCAQFCVIVDREEGTTHSSIYIYCLDGTDKQSRRPPVYLFCL